MSIFFLIYKFPLPRPSNLDPLVYEFEPNITSHTPETFTKTYKNKTYEFTKHGSYDIYALVVAKYDSENIFDVTHKKDPAQSKDLCIVWGETAKNGSYQNVKFSHGEFTCFYRTKSRTNMPEDLTNNHLIAENDGVKSIMDKIAIGDQVRISADLVDYKIMDERGELIASRKTSTTLGDRDCEVLYVKDIEIIKPINIFQRYIKSLLIKTTLVSSVLIFISFFV